MIHRLVMFTRKEWLLGISLGTSLIFFFDDTLSEHLANPYWLGILSIWLFAVILGAALSVVRHADHLAIRLGEPYGTLILTLAVTSIEVMSISAVMTHGDNPAMARDTLFSVIMIVLNGMVGFSLLIGAWRHREQYYNLQGANTYLCVIIPLAVLSLILPNYTLTTPGPKLSALQETFLAIIFLSLYGAFLVMQTGRHRGYFHFGDETEHNTPTTPHPLAYHAILLAIYMVPVIFLAEQFSKPLDYLIDTLHVPGKLGGITIALLVATPEALGAIRAAIANRLQRAVNIFLGSVLSTIGLTIPAILAVSSFSGQSIVLGLQHTDTVMLLLTLTVSIVTFASGRTNVLQGLVHLILFAAYLLLIFEN